MSSTRDIPRRRFAKMYLKVSERAERRGGREHRRRLLEGLSGHVVEVGAGNGLNFRHYPRTVSRVLAIEPEPTLRAAAAEWASRLRVPVTVSAGSAEALPGDDGEFDAAVASLVLCSVPDQSAALAELHRVLRPGGELRFYEHVLARRPPLRAFLQLADRSGLWPAIAGGCHPARDTAAAIEAAGFEMERCKRFPFRACAIEPNLPHILGTARRVER